MKKAIVAKLAKYENQYVALSENRSMVLASAATIRQLEEKLTKLNRKDIIITYVAPLNKYISPVCL